MYLQALELIGFKSFADRTRLVFQPGLTAVVGPNGCGKSNIADAVRWTLGEQSAKALRGSRMEDCIFNGTEDRKPMGMAEVSLTFAACEDVLGTEYHEVTVTRRVFRSGEGQYFLNRTPCRLKDIQRLFMGTGIGTTSYSLMEQGRIDQVLSSRPEDRRAVFEEASGITRFKTDRREALRKLEQTEANLLRLGDVIREVKRQIGSVQRQAGKARRYQALRDELRVLETERARRLLAVLDREMTALTSEDKEADERLSEVSASIEELGARETVARGEIAQLDETSTAALRSVAEYRAQLERNRDLIRVNGERIAEQKRLIERDTAEIETARRRQTEQSERMAALRAQVEETRALQQQAAVALESKDHEWRSHEKTLAEARDGIESLRRQTVEAESALARLQNELTALEQSERATVLRRERLLVEQEQAAALTETADARVAEMNAQMETLRSGVEEADRALAAMRQRRQAVRTDSAIADERLKELQTSLAGVQGQLEILQAAEAQAENFPGGARALMASDRDPGRPAVLGPLAHAIEVDDGYLPAVNAVLRCIADALLVPDRDTALQALEFLADGKSGSVRLAPLRLRDDEDGHGRADKRSDADELLYHVRGEPGMQPLLRRLFAGVLVVDSPAAIPALPDPGCRVVTRDGLLLRSDGVFDYRDPDEAAADPLARRHRVRELSRCRKTYDTEIKACLETRAGFEKELAESDTALERQRLVSDDRRRALALQEGQHLVIARDAEKARQRLKTVALELEQLENCNRDNGLKKGSLSKRMGEVHARLIDDRRKIEERNADLKILEQDRSPLLNEVGELRLRAAETNQTMQHLENQMPAAVSRLDEIEQLIAGREKAVAAAAASVERMQAEITAAEKHVAELQDSAGAEERRAAGLRAERDKLRGNLDAALAALEEARRERDRLQTRRSELQVAVVEHRLQRGNLIERMASDYNVGQTDLSAPGETDLPGGQGRNEGPEQAAEETARDDRIVEIKSRIEAMGPVNLIAIEEFRELEERFAFLNGQNDDLVAARASLLDTIRRINVSTSEMFARTFEQVNINFQDTFSRLFNGGKARLELTDTADVLESGIDIIARPPGKRQQNISLLSGGERTLTAVALLFAIYMIKPSPFCLLDEIDAALDENNINRFLGILKGFLEQSQFIVITHNRRTIASAGAIYGITMPENGLSSVLSMKFIENGEPVASERAAAADDARQA